MTVNKRACLENKITLCLCFFPFPLCLALIKTNWVVNLILSQKFPNQRQKETHF